MGKLVLLSAIVVSWATGESGGGTSPRLETRLSSERVMVDLERLWWLPLLLLLGRESVVDWMEAYEGCLCRCGLGERRDVMGICGCSAWRCHQKKGGDRMSRRTLSPSHPAPLVRSLARLYKAEDVLVLCCQGAV